MTSANLSAGQLPRGDFFDQLAIESKAEMARLLAVQTEWLTIAPFAAKACVPVDTVISWEEDLRIFSVDYEGTRYYPVFVLDKQTGQPLPDMKEVIAEFAGADRPVWDLAFWMVSLNGYLEGSARPADELARNSRSVLDAARIEAEGIQHG